MPSHLLYGYSGHHKKLQWEKTDDAYVNKSINFKNTDWNLVNVHVRGKAA